MGRLIALVLGLAAVAFAAKYALTGSVQTLPSGEISPLGNPSSGISLQSNPSGESQPKRQLDHVRAKAKELERLQQKAADDLAANSAEIR